VVTPEQRRTVVRYARTTVEVSERTACRFLGIHRALVRYRRRRVDDPRVWAALTEWAAKKRRWGVPRLTDKLRRLGFCVNPKRIARMCRDGRLLLLRRKGRKRVAVVRTPRLVPTGPNQRWSMDFVHDRLADGRAFRVLTILDEGTREAPALVAARSLSGAHVVAALDRLAASRGLPQTIAVDNGTEFTSRALDQWADERGVHLHFSRPGKPNDNAFIESFNSRLRDESLNEHWFTSMRDAARKIEAWRVAYNTEHSHSSLGRLTPAEYAARFTLSAPAEITRLSA
jgi:putative transposase